MNNKTLIMIFAKNLEKGKVKTRLAKSIGESKALMVYEKLLHYTHGVVTPLNTDKAIFYGSFIADSDVFSKGGFQKYVQRGEDLGARMHNAFDLAFKKDYEQVIVIGSDCHELNSGILMEAILALENNEFVIGPAHDGGYYLMGMKHLERNKVVFANKKWSTENVFLDTLLDIQNMGATYYLLPTLNDIDELEDIKNLDLLKVGDENRADV